MFRSARAEAVAGELLVRKLYEEHGRAILAYATRLTGDRHRAEGVVEETLVRAWRYSDAIVLGGDWVRGWLLSTVENVVLERSAERSAPPWRARAEPVRLPAVLRTAIRKVKVSRMNAVRTSEAPLSPVS
ncbi:MAG TPA: sigma factor [Umezawaea sp.]|nr:sigma factor [Umezawaea sp.]